MLDDDTTTDSHGTDGGPDPTSETPAPAVRTRRRAVSRPAGPPAATPDAPADTTETPAETAAPAKKTAKKAAAKKTAKKATTPRKRKAAPADEAPVPDEAPAETPAAEAPAVETPAVETPVAETPVAETPVAEAPVEEPAAEAPVVTTSTRRRRASRPTAAPLAAPFSAAETAPTDPAPAETASDEEEEAAIEAAATAEAEAAVAAEAAAAAAAPLFQAPETVTPPTRTRTRRGAGRAAGPAADPAAAEVAPPVDAPQAADSGTATSSDDTDDDADDSEDGQPRRRRRRGGRRRRKSGADLDADADTETTDDTGESAGSGAPAADDSSDDAESDSDDAGEGTGTSSRRRRRRRRRGEGETSAPDDSGSTAGQSGRVRDAKLVEDEITSVGGSTRLEAKKQRRREGREAGRRRAPIVSESEFLARREAVKREMVIRQKSDLTQIAVMEDDVLVEHYVARESQTSLIGNIYLGRVQNVLPSMEAAFVDIGKGRNAVLYAGEVDWKTLGNGKQRKIEDVLKSGQSVLVQVTKDPIGHKGARLTSQISLAGRFLVYVPGGQTNGISRKLPDTERNRLKGLLKEVLPEDAGVIIRTAAEGASEEQLTRDVGALTARWDDIERKSAAGGKAPQLLYGEPDLTLKVVRDLFNEDFEKLVIQGDDAWDMVKGYVDHVAPDLAERAVRWDGDRDAFAAHRVDEQIAKALDRKVWLPSGGSLIIDRTEAMTVVDVNTGKFTGSGGNLEETVTKNNLEAAEEIVRQLRLRDIGGIIVVDFIDMVLESNRDLVLRRMVECLGRDRTRHQVAEVTSLGLVQMTRKRIGTGLLEAFSEPCPHCHGRGLVTHDEPVEHRHDDGAPAPRGGRKRGDGANQGGGNQGGGNQGGDKPAPETSGDAPSPRTTGRRGGRGSGRAPSEATPADVAPLEVPVPQAPAPDEAGRPVDHEPPSPGTTEVTTVVVEATEGAEAATAPVEPTEPAEPTEAVEPVKAPAKRATRAPRRATRKAAAPTPTAEVPPVLTGDDPTP